MDIEHGCTLNDAEAIAGLFFEGFAKETRLVFGSPGSMARVMHKSMNPATCIAAREAGRLAGMAVLDLEDRHLFHPRLKQFTAEYGRLDGLRRFVLMLMLGTGSHKDLFYLDTLTVGEGRRGEGIGSRLLAEVEREAARQGHGSVVLDVVDENPRARKLYESLGFREVKHRRLPLYKPIFGFSGYSRMEKRI
jgi:ribosomal protein S18 acetylase RimI-like enzyme